MFFISLLFFYYISDINLMRQKSEDWVVKLYLLYWNICDAENIALGPWFLHQSSHSLDFSSGSPTNMWSASWSWPGNLSVAISIFFSLKVAFSFLQLKCNWLRTMKPQMINILNMVIKFCIIRLKQNVSQFNSLHKMWPPCLQNGSHGTDIVMWPVYSGTWCMRSDITVIDINLYQLFLTTIIMFLSC